MAREKRDEAEIQATCEELPDMPPEEVVESVKNDKLKAGVLIYRSAWYTDPLTEMKEEKVLVKCTHCGGTAYLDKVRGGGGCWTNGYSGDKFGFIDPADNSEKHSGSCCICPCCGVGMEAVHISRIGLNGCNIDYCNFMTAQVIRNHYVFLTWRAIKHCDKEGNAKVSVFKLDAMTVIGKHPVRFSGYTIGYYNCLSFHDEWVARPKYFTDYDTIEYSHCYGLSDKDTAGTELEKSGAVEFVEKAFYAVPLAAYLKLWARYPSVENLVRSGHGSYLKQVIMQCTVSCGWYTQKDVFYVDKTKDYINFKKVKPHEMLGLDKEELPIADACHIDSLKVYKDVKAKTGEKLTIDELKKARRLDLDDAQFLVDYDVKASKVLRYLEQQKDRCGGRPDLVRQYYLEDYWRMTKEVYGEISPSLKWPKKLREAHDRITAIYTEKQSAETTNKIKAYAKEMAKLAFQDEETGLLIRPISSQRELILEGKKLEHCVASYAKKYAARETCIFAIRRITAPNKPFFTLEFKNGAVAQNRGRNNCSRTEEVTLFEEKWLNFIKKQGAIA